MHQIIYNTTKIIIERQHKNSRGGYITSLESSGCSSSADTARPGGSGTVGETEEEEVVAEAAAATEAARAESEKERK